MRRPCAILRIHGADIPQLQERLFLDALCDVFHVMAERGVANISATNPTLGVNLRLNLERFGTEVFDRSTGLKNGLLFMALPRSASLYVFETLAAGLGLDRVAIGTPTFPNTIFNPNLVARLAAPGTMCYSHADARLGNLALIHRFIDRLVVHVRDPAPVDAVDRPPFEHGTQHAGAQSRGGLRFLRFPATTSPYRWGNRSIG